MDAIQWLASRRGIVALGHDPAIRGYRVQMGSPIA